MYRDPLIGIPKPVSLFYKRKIDQTHGRNELVGMTSFS